MKKNYKNFCKINYIFVITNECVSTFLLWLSFVLSTFSGGWICCWCVSEHAATTIGPNSDYSIGLFQGKRDVRKRALVLRSSLIKKRAYLNISCKNHPQEGLIIQNTASKKFRLQYFFSVKLTSFIWRLLTSDGLSMPGAVWGGRCGPW